MIRKNSLCYIQKHLLKKKKFHCICSFFQGYKRKQMQLSISVNPLQLWDNTWQLTHCIQAKYFISKIYLTARVCLQCRTVLPNPMCLCEPQLLPLSLVLPQRPPKRRMMNEVLSDFSPLVALNPSCYLLHCQSWQWWTGGRQLTTPLFITQKERRKECACQLSMPCSDL